MKILWRAKDGGPTSTVTGYWLIEWKRLFSIALLKFEDGSRDEYHSHAFNSLSWVLTGKLVEWFKPTLERGVFNVHEPSLKPVVTKRSTFHRVVSDGTTWVLTFRGPWSKTWQEWDPKTNQDTTLGHGRVIQGDFK